MTAEPTYARDSLQGPEILISLAGMKSQPRVLAIVLAGAAVLLLIGGTDAPNTPVSLIAATIMVLAWVPITRLSGR